MTTEIPFGSQLRHRRRLLDLTQAGLAQQVGCAPITIKKIEAGALRPSRQVAELLAQHLQLPVAEREDFVRLARRHGSVGRASALPNPYKGLRAFEEGDAADFFGRAALVERLVARLAEPHPAARFLAVLGPSGSGKSSAVRAGLVPALRGGALDGPVQVALCVPGAEPLAAIAAALDAMRPLPDTLALLQAGPQGLVRAARRLHTPLALVIDQFEELWTLCADEPARVHLLALLCEAATSPRTELRVVVTLRADFYDRPLRYGAFGTLLRERTEVVLPLAPLELHAAVAGPAARAGVQVEPALLAAIARDVAAEPGSLPLLQFALTELWGQREGATLTLAAYQAGGGIAGAIAERADATYEELDADCQRAARRLFLQLVAPGENADDTRRRVPLPALETLDGAAPALAAFERHRLLTFDRDAQRGLPTVELAHEVLIGQWRTLKHWLDASRADLLLQRQLAQAAQEWQRAEYDASFLATGARLAQLAALATSDLALSADERAFLDASLAEQARQQQVERERQERLAADLRRSEALRLASEANRLIQASGNAELIALLALRSIRTQYTPQGDEALEGAARLAFPLRVMQGSGSALAPSPDGRLLALGGRHAELFDLATGEHLRTFRSHADYIGGVAFSPDGRRLLTNSVDRTARLWEIASGEELRCFHHPAPHTTPMTLGAAISPDGALALIGSQDGVAYVCAAHTLAVLRELRGHSDVVTHAVFTPDGTLALTASVDGTARIWHVASGQELRRLEGHTNIISRIDVSPDGRLAVTGSYDHTARLWDIETGAELRRFAGHREFIKGACFTPDGKAVATGSDDGTARLWDVETGAELRRFVGHPAFVFDVAVSPDGAHLFTTAGGDGTTKQWSLLPAEPLPTLRGHKGAVHAAFSPDGLHALTWSRDATAALWDTQTGERLHTFEGHNGDVTSAAFSPDSRQIVTGSYDATVRLWDCASGQQVRTFTGHTSHIAAIRISPDGQLLLTASGDRTARLWHVATGETLYVFEGHREQIFDADFLAGKAQIVTGSVDGTTRLWDATTGEAVWVIEAGSSSLAASPDGERIYTSDWGGSVIERDAASGAELRRFRGHTGAVWTTCVAPNRRWLLTASGDGTARLWELATGFERRRLVAGGGTAWSADITPDGQRILSGHADGVARLWHADERETARYLESKLLRDFLPFEREQYGIE